MQKLFLCFKTHLNANLHLIREFIFVGLKYVPQDKNYSQFRLLDY